jgi:ABC-2 type transport system ATP-binding protein
MTIALSINKLEKVYSNGFEALKGIDLTVEEGDFFALLGPNGAGKSTTIGIICSLVNKTGGTIKVFDQDIDVDFSAAKKFIGIVPQEYNFHHFETPFEIVSNQAGYYGLPRELAVQRAEKYLKLLDLWDKRSNRSRDLSGGMKRRLMIARALVHEPKLLILDEPTAGVDIELRRSMWAFLQDINRNGTTIILTTHYLEEAESLCRNIAIIDNGVIVENTSMKELLRQLHKEVFILDTVETLSEAPKLAGFDCHLVDEHCIEVTVDKAQNMNQLFDVLSNQSISIASMRNKSNRLEELFVGLVGNNKPATVKAI